MCTNLGIVVSTPPITPHTLHSSTPDVGDQSGSTRSRKCQIQFSTFHVNSPHNVHTNQNGWVLSLYAKFMPLCTLLHLSSILGHKVIMRRQDHKGCSTRREMFPIHWISQSLTVCTELCSSLKVLTLHSSTSQSIASMLTTNKFRATDNEHIPPTAQVTGLTYFQQLTAPPIR